VAKLDRLSPDVHFVSGLMALCVCSCRAQRLRPVEPSRLNRSTAVSPVHAILEPVLATSSDLDAER
jgi:hypothetical protein